MLWQLDLHKLLITRVGFARTDRKGLLRNVDNKKSKMIGNRVERKSWQKYKLWRSSVLLIFHFILFDILTCHWCVLAKESKKHVEFVKRRN